MMEGAKKIEELKTPETKRVSRSPTLIDMDDLRLLLFLCPNVSGKLIKTERSMDYLKKKMNMGNKGLVVHLKRLNSLGFIEIYRVPPENKRKIVIISDSGDEIKKILLRSLYKQMDWEKQRKN